MKRATQDDWKTEALPEENVTLTVERRFTEFEMERIRLGLIPEYMEDKWFAYFADDTLYWHRSWTGICIYVADFTQDGDTYHIERLRANRNKEQYGETNDDSDVGLFLRLVDNLLINRRI